MKSRYRNYIPPQADLKKKRRLVGLGLSRAHQTNGVGYFRADDSVGSISLIAGESKA